MNNKTPAILLVDNYDSFTYNLVQILREQGESSLTILKNDKIKISDAGRFDGFIFSPGPGIPEEVPVMSLLLRTYCSRSSFLGICLGHQAIAETFGMKLVKKETVRHGLQTLVRVIDPAEYIFDGIPREFRAGLYHSWAVKNMNEKEESGPELIPTAVSNDETIMAVRHTIYDIRGVQFHPESYLTEYGSILILNWIRHLKNKNAP